jgi:hypothetical protein
VALASAANAVTDMASDLAGEKREHREINQVEGPVRDVAKATSLAGYDLTSSYDFSSLLAARVFGRDELSQAVCVQARKYESAMEPSVTGDGLDRSEPMRSARAAPWPAVVGGQLRARLDLRCREPPSHLDRGWGGGRHAGVENWSGRAVFNQPALAPRAVRRARTACPSVALSPTTGARRAAGRWRRSEGLISSGAPRLCIIRLGLSPGTSPTAA